MKIVCFHPVIGYKIDLVNFKLTTFMIQNKSQKVKWVGEFYENTKNSINRMSRENLIGSHTIILQKFL